jgi:hypothetical protein
MLDIGKILKRAWHILWNYKILWIFGILLAITSGGRGGGSNGGGGSGGGSGYEFGGGQPDLSKAPQWIRQLNDWFQQNLVPLFVQPAQHISTFIWIGVVLLLIIIIFATISAIVRYVSETAILRMVDEYEQTGTKVGFRQGWKKGWSRAAFRIWLIDLLIIAVPIFVLILLLIGLGLAVYSGAGASNHALLWTSVAFAVACFLPFIVLFVLLMIFVSLLRQFFVRKAALENLGVRESFRQGWQMFKHNWKDAGLMWLVMVGLGIGFALASVVAVIVLIPVFVLTGAVGLIVAAVPALIAFGISSLFTIAPLAWIIAALVGLPFFILVLGSPLALIGGWAQIFTSSVWTLTYRELKTLEHISPPQATVTTS